MSTSLRSPEASSAVAKAATVIGLASAGGDANDDVRLVACRRDFAAVPQRAGGVDGRVVAVFRLSGIRQLDRISGQLPVRS